jgi:hypothetical protein
MEYTVIVQIQEVLECRMCWRKKYAKQFLHKSADKEFDKNLIRGKPPKITIHLLFALTPPKILLEI